MYTVDEKDREYRHGNHGPKYLMKGPYSNFGVVRLLPGEVVEGHRHRLMEENFYILSGSVEFDVEGQTVLLQKGQFLHLEPGEGHTIRNSENEVLQMIISAAPFAENDKYPL